MRKIEQICYKCDYCGFSFDTEEQAEKHEALHKNGLSIKGAMYCYDLDFPCQLTIESGDGCVAAYILKNGGTDI